MRLRQVVCVWLNRWAVTVLLLIAATSGRVVLAAASAIPDSLQACTREQDDSRRLACYDLEMRRLAVAPAPAPALTHAPDKSFGLSPEQARKLEPPGAHEKVTPQTLSSTVSAVSTRVDGRVVITLANGQTWVQGEAYELFRVNVGDAVTIKPGALGSFHMYAPSGFATRVTRAR
jgi:hypothetical protein